jgi:beta-lactamase class A
VGLLLPHADSEVRVSFVLDRPLKSAATLFMRFSRRLTAILSLGLLLAASHASANDQVARGSRAASEPRDPVFEKLRLLERVPYADDPAPLWNHFDSWLQSRLEGAVDRLGLSSALRDDKLAVALVDITDRKRPRVAAVNGDDMMYAASLPKIAILLGAYEKASLGLLILDSDIKKKIDLMIRRSSNWAATDVMKTVGREYIASVLMSPRYRLYDPAHNGGLWVGKDYAGSTAWRRDPLHNLSHAATAMQVARFYYLLANDKLVSREYSRQMLDVLGRTDIDSKFMKGIRTIDPEPTIFRKSGSWGTFNSDSAIIRRDDGRTYIAVALSDDRAGADWLARLIVEMDEIIAESPVIAQASESAVRPQAVPERSWWASLLSPKGVARSQSSAQWPRRKSR